MRGDPRRNADAVKNPEGSITDRGYVKREEFEDLERVEHVLSQQPYRTNDHR